MYDKASCLLYKELDEQILPDGSHYEQSPMYHCILLIGYWIAIMPRLIEVMRKMCELFETVCGKDVGAFGEHRVERRYDSLT